MMGRSTRSDGRVQAEIERTRQFFNKSRPASTAKSSPVHEHVFAVISALIPHGSSGSKAVDLGCHWGRYTKVIAETYGHVVGVDVSEKAIVTAEKRNNI